MALLSTEEARRRVADAGLAPERPVGASRCTRSRRTTATFALLVAGALAGALLSELALRIYVRTGGPTARRLEEFDPVRVQVEPYGTLGYRQRPHARFRYDNGTVAHANSLGYRGPEITLAKPPGVRRVVLLGGSTTHGWGVDDTATIDAYMRRRLASARIRFEIINAGLDGYDSRQILERIEHDVLRLDPDVLIINSGINDVRNARFPNLVDGDPRTLIWHAAMEQARHEAEHGRSWWTMAKHYSLLLRLPPFIVSRSQQSPAADSTVTGYPEAAELFERNLRRIVDLARPRGIRLVFSTAPSSLRALYPPDAKPATSYWLRDAETTARYRDTLAARTRRVVTTVPGGDSMVVYVRPQLPAEMFLDDAHLTAEGNAAVAEAFSDAVLSLFRQ